MALSGMGLRRSQAPEPPRWAIPTTVDERSHGGSKHERKGHMRNRLWGIVLGGVMGALLWAGAVGAQPPTAGGPGDEEPCAVFPGDGVDGAALSYTENGDGTVTDNNTLLMWEVKDTSGGIHDVDNIYKWDEAFSVFLVALNTTPCFAGYCDWRLPNVKELRSIVDHSRTLPAISPSFGPTVPHWYLASPIFANPAFVWNVDFSIGVSVNVARVSAVHVRAVRGGR
jgi:Protein of unknown function (DUF1566)